MFSLMVGQPRLWECVLLQTYCLNLEILHLRAFLPQKLSLCVSLREIYNIHFPSQTHKISDDLYRIVIKGNVRIANQYQETHDAKSMCLSDPAVGRDMTVNPCSEDINRQTKTYLFTHLVRQMVPPPTQLNKSLQIAYRCTSFMFICTETGI